MNKPTAAVNVVLFDNNRRASEKAPTQTGKITFNEPMTFQAGETLDVALWNWTSKTTGTPYRSGTAKRPDPKYAGNSGHVGGTDFNRTRSAAPADIVDF